MKRKRIVAGVIFTIMLICSIFVFSACKIFVFNFGKTGTKASKGLLFEGNVDENSYTVYIGDCTDTEIVIPATYNGLPVTSIGEKAFDCSRLTSITIPDSVTSIGSWAFGRCSSLTSITMPDSVISIGYSAFYNCSLTNVTIPDSVTSIGTKAFSHCGSLTSVTIGDGVTSIGGDAFSHCGSLTSVTIGDNVTSIGYSAFYNCSRLTSITIPDSVTFIGEGVFSRCNSLTSVYYMGTIDQWAEIKFEDWTSSPLMAAENLYINNELITEVNLTIATKISDYAFYNCGRLTSVIIGDSVTSIGGHAFSGCSSLTSVIIGNCVQTIGEVAFFGCPSLTSVTFEKPYGWIVFENYSTTDGKTYSLPLDNESQNAKWLTNIFSHYYWKRI